MSRKTRMGTLALALALVLAVCVLVLVLPKGEQDIAVGNLLKNGDFSEVENGMPRYWNTGMWVTHAGASYLEATTAADGTAAVLVENVAANDARFEQTVAVRENATYRLTARVMAEGCDPDEMGANLSFLGIYGASEDLHDTEGAWQTVTLYAHTGRGQKEATVCARLGGYGSEATGRAWFTDVRLEQVEDAPVGAFVLDLSTPEPQREPTQKGDKRGVIPILLALGVAEVLAVVLLMRRRPSSRALDAREGHIRLAWILGLALAVRIAGAAIVPGYGVDMGCFSAWAGRMAEVGPAGFYEAGYFCDYPPAYMLVLGALGKLAGLFGISLSTMDGQMLLKSVPIFCDILLALIVYRATERRAGRGPALGMAFLTASSLAYAITSACWGQIDSVLAVLLAVMLLQAQAGRWQIAIPVFALAVLAKPQAGLLVPLGLAALLRDLIREKETRKPIALGLLGGAAVTAVIVLPFSVHQASALWLVDKYVETLSSYAYATLSTGNLMFLLGGNWTGNEQAVLGPVTYGQLGMALMVLAFAFGVLIYLRGQGRKRLMLASAATMQLVFVLGSKMHERYILPALVLLLLAYVETADMRLLCSFALASAAAAVNIGAVLAFEHLIAPNLWLGYGIGVVQIIAAGLTVWASVSLSLGREPMRLRERQAAEGDTADGETEDRHAASASERRMREELLQARNYKLHLNRRDVLLMLALTAVYGVVGFWKLGAMKAPQGGYTSTRAGESVVIDLGERHEDFHLYYYGGVSNTSFTVATSDDGEVYGEEIGALFDIGECYKWLAMRQPIYAANGKVSKVTGGMLPFSGRYIRLTFDGAASALWEVAAVDGEGQVILPAGVKSFDGVQGRMSDPNTLIDEQDTVPDKPSWFNSMYFDEIYHGRTGYEHAHAQPTYETTHPPLGKVFMSWCIRLMGMTPFAWRFAGALCGVLMVPVIYLLAKTLLGSTLWASLCALLLSADCMHYTQTRIATIDSFPVLFMMLMFLFMARWMKMSFYHQRLRDTLVPLALSGICMGLAIASKWIGCYGAVGLAVLFFARFIALMRQGLYAEQHRDEHPAFVRAAETYRDKGIRTILACCVFFVLVPVVIYVLSYIPYLRAYGEIKWNLTTLTRIWDAQVLMFDYHKNLVAEHYFASPWYEWPLIVKPMWYYNADYKGAGMASSILAFGNPAVWWTGLLGILFVLGYSAYRNALPALGVLAGREDEDDRAMPVIAVGFLSAYLPWVLVSRLTFIYHYFASVPWIIIATALALKYLARRRRKLAYGLAAALSVAAIALFIAFYPLASGMEVPRAWCDAVAWFPGWMWY